MIFAPATGTNHASKLVIENMRLVAALGMCGGFLLTGCGGSTPVDFFADGGGRAGTQSAAASQGRAGDANASAGQSNASAGQSTGSGGDLPTEPSDTPCAPVKDVAGGMSGPFDTAGPVCLRVQESIVGWGCSNFEGRTLKVNGQSVSCEQTPLPEALHGVYYFDVSAGEKAYASLYWF